MSKKLRVRKFCRNCVSFKFLLEKTSGFNFNQKVVRGDCLNQYSERVEVNGSDGCEYFEVDSNFRNEE